MPARMSRLPARPRRTRPYLRNPTIRHQTLEAMPGTPPRQWFWRSRRLSGNDGFPSFPERRREHLAREDGEGAEAQRHMRRGFLRIR